jgi:hypothetical protein
MNSENITHLIWALFCILSITVMSSCAQNVSEDTEKTNVEYINSDCSRNVITGSKGTHWVCQ